MMQNQSSRAAEKEALRDRKKHLVSLVELIRNKKTKLDVVETLSVQALNAEIQRIEGHIIKLP